MQGLQGMHDVQSTQIVKIEWADELESEMSEFFQELVKRARIFGIREANQTETTEIIEG
jgi:hypothetical protein